MELVESMAIVIMMAADYYSDAFILKFNNNGTRFWPTYYGGNDDDWITSISIDADGNVFVAWLYTFN